MLKFSKISEVTLNLLFLFLSRIYTLVFARPSLQPINDRLLKITLMGRGYNSQVDESIIINRILNKFQPKLCIDIGANVGNYSKDLLKYTSSDVIAFEPLPSTFSKLRVLEDQYPDRFNAVNMGLGNTEDIVSIYFGKNSEIASFSQEVNHIEYVKNNNTNTIKVPITTLDKYLKSYQKNINQLDFIKIDTEGFEYEVIQGARETLTRLRPKLIQLEFNWHHLFKNISLYQFSEILPEYKVYQLLPYGSGLIKRDTKQPESNVYHFSNFLFCLEDISI